MNASESEKNRKVSKPPGVKRFAGTSISNWVLPCPSCSFGVRRVLRRRPSQTLPQSSQPRSADLANSQQLTWWRTDFLAINCSKSMLLHSSQSISSRRISQLWRRCWANVQNTASTRWTGVRCRSVSCLRKKGRGSEEGYLLLVDQANELWANRTEVNRRRVWMSEWKSYVDMRL